MIDNAWKTWIDTAGFRMPLARPRPWNAGMSAQLAGQSTKDVFPSGRSPMGAFAGLLLYLGEWERAHEVAQDLHTPEGAYWHAIVHRQEPDAWNSNYWFRQTGRHAIFPGLVEAARAAAMRHPHAAFPEMREWQPAAFVDYCEQARQSPGSAAEVAAIEIQHIEWKMLWEYCREG